MSEEATLNPVELATDLTIAWLSNPNTRASAEDVPEFLAKMHQAVSGLAVAPSTEAEGEQQPAAPEHTPAVSVRKSLGSRDHIISMIDGKPYKSLKRHIGTHGMTPAEYRQRYGLKADYPMVAPAYAEQRRALAKKIGLGRKPGQKVGSTAKSQAAPKPAGRGTKPKAAAAE